MIFLSPQCKKCKHLFDDKHGYRCAAFPEGIPEPILTGEFSHSILFPRQENDILFENRDRDEHTLDDFELMFPKYSEVCAYCKNLIPNRFRSCKAFPEHNGIPYDIWTGGNPHTTRHPDQTGDIVFEQKACKSLKLKKPPAGPGA